MSTAAFEVSASRTYPAGVARSFDAVIAVPLTRIFRHRYLLLPPIVETLDQQGEWGTVGQQRTLVLADRSRMRETLTSVDRPASFGYRITLLSGPLKALVADVEGRWEFAQAGTGVRVTWAWRITPRSGAAARLRPVIGRLWRGYARQALAEIESVLLPG